MPHCAVDIRPYESADADAVVALWQACDLTRPWNDPRKDIARKVAVADDLFLVGSVDGAVVATVMGGYDGHRGRVNYLGAGPWRRARGLGRALMDAVEVRRRGLGCPKINLQVRETKPEVLAFYARLGYAVEASVSLGKRLESDDS